MSAKLSLLLCIAFALNTAQGAELRVLVDTGMDMPLARFERGQLVEGIHHDIGQVIAQQLGRTARFMGLPRKRITRALETGEADVLCLYQPAWLPGKFQWSKPFFPVVEVLIATTRVARPLRVQDVSGQSIGTVLGYNHPELEEALGAGFVREDGANMDTNLRKLAAGRIHYAVTGKAFFDYRLKQGDLQVSYHPSVLVQSYMTQCALSPKSKLSLADLDAALSRLQKDGAFETIERRYQ